MPQKKLFDLRFSLIILFQLIIVGIGLKGLWKNNPIIQDDDLYRQVGNQLETTGVLTESIDFYEKQLAQMQAKDQNPQLLYRVGELYEQVGLYEKALSRFTWAKFLATSDKDQTVKDDSSKKIVALLERLRKYSAAKRELSTSTSLETKDNLQKGGVIIANIGNKNIYLHDFEKVYDQWLASNPNKEGMDPNQAKSQFLQKYIADEMMYEKALKMELEKDPIINSDLETIKKQLFVQKLLEKELGAIAKIDPTDVENYYKANSDKYNTPEMKTVYMVKSKTRPSDNKSLVEDKKNMYQISENQAFMNLPLGFNKTIFQAKEGTWIDPVLHQGYYYSFKVVSTQKAGQKTFDQIQQKVQLDYQQEKAQKAYASLVEEMLKSEKVQIHWDKLESK